MGQFYLFFKAMHIVGFVSWFAGLFYLVRMFVYHSEVHQKPLAIQDDWKKQYTLMQWRVYKIISTPAMMFTWTFGLAMLLTNSGLLSQTWIQIKLLLLVLLTAYHLYCKRVIQKLERGENPYTSFQFRLMNELPTLFLVAIVLLAVVRNMLNFLYLFLGILTFGVVLYLAAKAYKKRRQTK